MVKTLLSMIYILSSCLLISPTMAEPTVKQADAFSQTDKDAYVNTVGDLMKTNQYAALDAWIARGGDVDAKNSQGDTALIKAVDTGFTAMVDLLLEKGADPAIPNAKGITAKALAESKWGKNHTIYGIFEEHKENKKGVKRKHAETS